MRRRLGGRWPGVPIALVALLLGGAVATWAVPAPPSWTVPVGQAPVALAVAATRGHLFVADSAADTVTMRDARTGAPLATTTVGQTPVALAVDETHGRVYALLSACAVTALAAAHACSNGAGSVSVLDLSSGALLGTWGVGGRVTALAMDERAGRLFVANEDAARLSVLDAGTGHLLRSVDLGGVAQGMAADVRLGHLFVSVLNAGVGHSDVRLFDGRSGRPLATTPVGQYVGSLLRDTRAGRVLVASDGDLYLLDARTGRTLRRIRDGGAPLAVDERAGRALISGQGHLRLIATRDGAPLGPRTGLGALDALAVQSVAVDETTGRFYVATDDALWVVNDHSGRTVRTLSLSALPLALTVDAAAHRVFILTSAGEDLSSPDHELPLVRWLRRTVPWLPFPSTPPAAGGTLTVLDTTRL